MGKKKIIISDEIKQLLDEVYGCESIEELQEEQFPLNTLADLKTAVEFSANLEMEFPNIYCFLEGVKYQKRKQKKSGGVLK